MTLQAVENTLPLLKDFIEVKAAARIYSSNRDAGLALGINAGSFGRLCRRYGIQTPQQRRRAQRMEAKGAAHESA